MDPGRRVVHEYLGNWPQRRDVPVEAREQFWADAVRSMKDSSYSDFYGAEFRNEDGQLLLVIHEDC